MFDSTRIWAKMASMGEFNAQSHCTEKQTIRLLNLCQKQNIRPKVKHGSGSPSVKHWGCDAASVPGQCAVNRCNHESCSLWDQLTWAQPSIAKMKVFKWTQHWKLLNLNLNLIVHGTSLEMWSVDTDVGFGDVCASATWLALTCYFTPVWSFADRLITVIPTWTQKQSFPVSHQIIFCSKIHRRC